ncbi:MAG: hypothetical protein ACLGHN_00385 [Bacteriovoracia bacterium]
MNVNNSALTIMSTLFKLLIIIAFISCSTVSEEEKIAAWEEWEGLSTETLEEHPYFKNLPLAKVKRDDGPETWIFKDESRFQTKAYCDSLGGCLGMPTYNCNNVFSVEKGVILGFEQSESCPGIKTIEAPNKSKE